MEQDLNERVKFLARASSCASTLWSAVQPHRTESFKLSTDPRVEAQLPKDLQVHLVMDNYGTHKTPKVIRWFARHPRYHIPFTPTSGSWMSKEYLEQYNKASKPFIWTADADLILGKVQRLCERLSNSGH